MNNKLLKQFVTQPDPMLGKEHTRLWLRYTYNRQAQLEPCYTVAVKNNVIVGNYKSLEEAEKKYNQLAREAGLRSL